MIILQLLKNSVVHIFLIWDTLGSFYLSLKKQGYLLVTGRGNVKSSTYNTQTQFCIFLVYLLQVSATTWAILVPSLPCFGAALPCIDLLCPQTFQQSSDPSLGHLHLTLATALCHPWSSLLWKIFNYWHEGEKLHQMPGRPCCRTARDSGACPKCRASLTLPNRESHNLLSDPEVRDIAPVASIWTNP